MKPALGRWVSGARDVLRPGGLDRLKHRLEDRVMNAVMQATRLTNDGGYRRYRDDPTARGELTPEPDRSTSAAGSASPAPGSATDPGTSSRPEPEELSSPPSGSATDPGTSSRPEPEEVSSPESSTGNPRPV